MPQAVEELWLPLPMCLEGAGGEGSRVRGCGCRPCLLTRALLSPAELSQVEITRAYLAKEADEISLQQADVVLVLGGEDGECRQGGAAAGEGLP